MLSLHQKCLTCTKWQCKVNHIPGTQIISIHQEKGTFHGTGQLIKFQNKKNKIVFYVSKLSRLLGYRLRTFVKGFKQEIKKCVKQWMHIKYRICSLEYLFIYLFFFIY